MLLALAVIPVELRLVHAVEDEVGRGHVDVFIRHGGLFVDEPVVLVADEFQVHLYNVTDSLYVRILVIAGKDCLIYGFESSFVVNIA